jgi:hypothetical protein
MTSVAGQEGLRPFFIEHIVGWVGWSNPLTHGPEFTYNEFDHNQISILMSDQVGVMKIHFHAIRIFMP